MVNILRIFIFCLVGSVCFGQIPFNDELEFKNPQLFDSTVTINDSTIINGYIRSLFYNGGFISDTNFLGTGAIVHGSYDTFANVLIFTGVADFGSLGLPSGYKYWMIRVDLSTFLSDWFYFDAAGIYINHSGDWTQVIDNFSVTASTRTDIVGTTRVSIGSTGNSTMRAGQTTGQGLVYGFHAYGNTDINPNPNIEIVAYDTSAFDVYHFIMDAGGADWFWIDTSTLTYTGSQRSYIEEGRISINPTYTYFVRHDSVYLDSSKARKEFRFNNAGAVYPADSTGLYLGRVNLPWDSIYVNNIQIKGGSTNGYVLQSDANGAGTWVDPITTLSGDTSFFELGTGSFSLKTKTATDASGYGSMAFGLLASASADSCYAFGKDVLATADNSYVFGNNASSADVGQFIFGNGAGGSTDVFTSAENAYAFGTRARSGHDNAFVFGTDGESTEDNQATFSDSITEISFIGTLAVRDDSISTSAGDAATINAVSGRFRKDNSGTTFTLTNSRITANSIIQFALASDPGAASAYQIYVTAGVGSATFTFGAAPSANADINFWIVN